MRLFEGKTDKLPRKVVVDKEGTGKGGKEEAGEQDTRAIGGPKSGEVPPVADIMEDLFGMGGAQ